MPLSVALAEQLAQIVLAAVVILLAASVLQQFRTVGPKGHLLDALALVPQWKFFAQDAVGLDPDWSDDWHVLARVAAIGDATRPTPWQPVIAPAVRSGWHFIWNPVGRSQAQLLAYAEMLGRAHPAEPINPVGLAYLTLLRACFDVVSPDRDQALQFAVVATRGRHERPVFLRYLSLWHVR